MLGPTCDSVKCGETEPDRTPTATLLVISMPRRFGAQAFEGARQSI